MKAPKEKPATTSVELSKRTADVKAWIEAKAGAEGRPFTPSKTTPPLVIIYKVMGKVFAILSVRGVEVGPEPGHLRGGRFAGAAPRRGAGIIAGFAFRRAARGDVHARAIC